VTTYVESIEMLGNLAAVRELTENQGNFGEISPEKTHLLQSLGLCQFGWLIRVLYCRFWNIYQVIFNIL